MKRDEFSIKYQLFRIYFIINVNKNNNNPEVTQQTINIYSNHLDNKIIIITTVSDKIILNKINRILISNNNFQKIIVEEYSLLIYLILIINPKIN